jgi:hypothetical protein
MSGIEQRRQLERRYQRLLLAYPRRYRRARGAELLTTLLEAAPAGRRWPTWAETVDLLVGGLRCRLGLPRGPLIKAAAILAALAAGALGVAAGGWLGWRGADALPSQQRALAITRTAAPEASMMSSLRRDEIFSYAEPVHSASERWLGKDSAYLPGQVQVMVGVEGAPGDVVAGAVQRMRSAGWDAQVRVEPWGVTGIARHGRLIVHLAAITEQASAGATQRSWLDVRVVRAEPWLVRPLIVAGGLVGLAAGWLLAGWAARRARAYEPAVRLGITALSGFGLLAQLPATVFTAYGLADPQRFAPAASWEAYMVAGARLPTVAGVLALTAVIAMAATASRPPPAQRTQPATR